MEEPNEPITLARVFWLLVNLGSIAFVVFWSLVGLMQFRMMSNCEQFGTTGSDVFDCGERYRGDK